MLKEQFINGLNDETVITKIIKEPKALKNTSKASSEQVLLWAQRVEAERAQKVVLGNIMMQRNCLIKKRYAKTRSS